MLMVGREVAWVDWRGLWNVELPPLPGYNRALVTERGVGILPWVEEDERTLGRFFAGLELGAYPEQRMGREGVSLPEGTRVTVDDIRSLAQAHIRATEEVLVRSPQLFSTRRRPGNEWGDARST